MRTVIFDYTETTRLGLRAKFGFFALINRRRADSNKKLSARDSAAFVFSKNVSFLPLSDIYCPKKKMSATLIEKWNLKVEFITSVTR